MEFEKNLLTVASIEEIKAWEKSMIEKQFSEIYKMAEAQWKIDSQYVAPAPC